MGFFDPENVRAVLGAGTAFVARPERADPGAAGDGVTGVSIDTRTISAGELFVAIRGDRFDGHAYVGDAVRAGSRVVIVEDASCLPDPVPDDLWALRVDCTRRALLRLGGAYRKTLGGVKVVGVTGSNGKTTAVRLIDAVLGEGLRGSASIRSFNNAVGVPLTILGASPNDQYLVAEVGTSAPGEIAELAAVLEPDIAVIVSIGHAHLESLGSLEGVAREKAALAGHARSLVVVNADAPHLLDSLPREPARLLYGSDESADLRLTGIENLGADGVSFELNGRARFRIPLAGEHNALNASAAVAVGRRLGLDDEQIARGLARASGPEMRLERRRIGGVDVINDAYNANPDSVIASLGSLGGAGSGRRVLVLGDMLELGEQSEALHAMVGRAISQRVKEGGGPDALVLVGDRACGVTDGLDRSSLEASGVEVVLTDPDRAAGVVRGLTRDGDLVLLKGSRAMRLERIAEALAGEAPERR